MHGKRRLEQRDALKKVIQYIKENQIGYLFIAGDLYEQEYIQQSTIEYCNRQFREIPDTKIFIAPGNHDPYLKNSYYKNYNWSTNVHIFNGELQSYEDEEAIIHGCGFTDFYNNDEDVEKIILKDKEKINILVTHGDLDASRTAEKNYRPISSKKLQEIGFDYVALGHVHNSNFNPNSRIQYAGSTICLGFDEIGKHGMIVRRNR